MARTLRIAALPGWPVTEAVAHVWASWKSLRQVELKWFLLAGLAYGLVDSAALARLPEGADPWAALSRHLLLPPLISLMLIPAWLPAARSDPDHPARLFRLALGAAVGAVVAMGLTWSLLRGLDWPTVSELIARSRGRAKPEVWGWAAFVGDCLSVFIPATLALVLFDLHERRRRGAEQLQRTMQEQASLAREAAASRLAALQAQVEPQFLFDALVGVEEAYARGDPKAPARIDALIHHLRVALPRLRGEGATLASEDALLASWLSVVGRLGGRPLVYVPQWAADVAGTPVPPMLLLPWLQAVLAQVDSGAAPCEPARSIGDTSPTPRERAGAPVAPLEVRLVAQATPAGLQVALRLGATGLCPPDAVQAALRERAAASWPGGVSLACCEESGESVLLMDLTRQRP